MPGWSRAEAHRQLSYGVGGGTLEEGCSVSASQCKQQNSLEQELPVLLLSLYSFWNALQSAFCPCHFPKVSLVKATSDFYLGLIPYNSQCSAFFSVCCV
jgi:hypothetical protein